MKYLKNYRLFESSIPEETVESLIGSFLRTYGAIPTPKKEATKVINLILKSNQESNLGKGDYTKLKLGKNIYLSKIFKNSISNKIRFGAYCKSLIDNVEIRGHNFEGLISGLFFGELSDSGSSKNDVSIGRENISDVILGSNTNSEILFSVKFSRNDGERPSVASFKEVINAAHSGYNKDCRIGLIELIENYTQYGINSVINKNYDFSKFKLYYDGESNDNSLKEYIKKIWDNNPNRPPFPIPDFSVKDGKGGDVFVYDKSKLPHIDIVKDVIKEELINIIVSEVGYILIGYPHEDKDVKNIIKLLILTPTKLKEFLMKDGASNSTRNSNKYEFRLPPIKYIIQKGGFDKSEIIFPKLTKAELIRHKLTNSELALSEWMFGKENKERIRPTVLRSFIDRFKDSEVLTNIEDWVKKKGI